MAEITRREPSATGGAASETMIKTGVIDTDFLKDQRIFETALRMIHPSRRARIVRYAQPRDRRNSLGATLLLMQMIEDRFQNPCRLAWKAAPGGKPFFEEAPELYFSLTHAEHYAACSVGDVPLGVDLEGDTSVSAKVAERFYSPTEKEWLRLLSEN
ncbi:MAG: hypothetical protein IJR83_01960, partial [Clostridia bacterium]|nr:hypothetical protein [Clostridia bacterium]